MAKRIISIDNAKLIGAMVSVEGTITITEYVNPVNRSEKRFRVKKYMLKPVWIADVEYDHLWIQNCNEIDHFQTGDHVSFTAWINTYQSKGKWKIDNDQSASSEWRRVPWRIAIKAPYENVSPPKPPKPRKAKNLSTHRKYPVVVKGQVIDIENKNPFSPSIKPFRSKMYMLKPAQINDVACDHLWIQCCKKIDHFKIGYQVSFTARMDTVYQWKEGFGMVIKFPYDNISPSKAMIHERTINNRRALKLKNSSS